MYVTSCTVLCLNSLYHNHIFNRPSKCMLNKKKSNVYSGALAHEARSGAPWVTKCGKLPILENLVIT